MLGDFWTAPVNANLKSAMCSKKLSRVRSSRVCALLQARMELYKEWTLPVESVPEKIGTSTLCNEKEGLGQ